MMKVIRFFEMSGSTFPVTQRSLTEDWNYIGTSTITLGLTYKDVNSWTVK